MKIKDLVNTNRNKAALKAMEMTPADFERLADQLDEQEREWLTDELMQIAIGAGRLAGYMNHRSGFGCGDQGHKAAVRNCNTVVKKIRKTLGFYATHDLSF